MQFGHARRYAEELSHERTCASQIFPALAQAYKNDQRLNTTALIRSGKHLDNWAEEALSLLEYSISSCDDVLARELCEAISELESFADGTKQALLVALEVFDSCITIDGIGEALDLSLIHI